MLMLKFINFNPVKNVSLSELLPVSVEHHHPLSDLFRKKSAKLKTGYKRDFMNAGCDLDFDLAGPTVHAAAVLGYEGWLAGYQMAFDTAKSKLVQNNFALGYKAGDFQLHTNV